MVTIFLRGGLGNQMFQYAAGLALAKANGGALTLDSVFVNDRFPRHNFVYRTFDLDIFKLDPHLTALSRASASVPIPGVWLGIDLVFISGANALGMKKLIKEKTEHAFDPAFFSFKGNVELWGRWQHERYFMDVESELREAFRFRYPLEGAAKTIGEAIAASNAISLNVRRGDFATMKTVVELMGETDMHYYERAIDHMAGQVKDPHFYIFSDDIEWCRANMHLKFPVTFVPAEAAGPKQAFHLELMSRCKHNIIANSTFSWWGAWLNAHPDKIVVMPKRWYASQEVPEGLVPKGWIRL